LKDQEEKEKEVTKEGQEEPLFTPEGDDEVAPDFSEVVDELNKADNSESLAKTKAKKERKPRKDKKEKDEKYAVKTGSKTLMYKVKNNTSDEK
jgi:hypothetical protein